MLTYSRTRLLTDDFWGTPMASHKSHKSYRPLTVLSFRLNHIIHELRPFGYHLVNTLLHAAVSALFLRVCQTTVFGPEQRGASLLAGVLFALHPVHTEAVVNVVGRAELLSALFFLLAFLQYQRCMRPGALDLGQLGVFCLLVAAATFSKEQGFTVVFCCIAYEIARSEQHSTYLAWLADCLSPAHRQTHVRLAVLGVFSLALMAVRITLNGNTPPYFQVAQNMAAASDDLLTRTLSFNYYAAVHAWLLVFPYSLCYDWSSGSIPLLTEASDPRVVAILALYAVLVLLVLKFRLLAGPFGAHGDRRIVFFALLLSVVPFLPSSSLFFRVGFTVAERVLYLPSMGFVVLLAFLLSKLSAATNATALGWTIILAYAAKTLVRNTEWKNIGTLTRADIHVNPTNAILWSNLAAVEQADGNIEQCAQFGERAVALQADHAVSLENYAICLHSLKRLEEAEAHALRAEALEDEPTANLLGLLASIHDELGRSEEAEAYYLRCIDMYPRYSVGRMNYAVMLSKQERFADERAQYEQILAFEPHNHKALLYVGYTYLGERSLRQAELAFKRAIAAKPDADAYYYMATTQIDQGRVKEGVKSLELALSLSGEHAAARELLAKYKRG